MISVRIVERAKCKGATVASRTCDSLCVAKKCEEVPRTPCDVHIVLPSSLLRWGSRWSFKTYQARDGQCKEGSLFRPFHRSPAVSFFLSPAPLQHKRNLKQQWRRWLRKREKKKREKKKKSEKVKSRSFKVYRAYSISLNSANVGNFFWSWILKDCIKE